MKRIAALVLFASLLASAHAQVSVQDAWVRATVPQQSVSGAFLRITSARDARLVEVGSPVAGRSEIHETRLENDMMKMRPVASVALPAGKAVELKPGGYHIMLMELKGALKEGQSIPLMLVVEDKDGKRENIEVKATVRPLSAHGGGHRGH
ncbi:MAG: copper chaperone PCu(A)C [Burkholderiales bacterium]|nr:copper chaperone PCu(A)C [Burkholderiales bacterium]